jgi:hypothetical protein
MTCAWKRTPWPTTLFGSTRLIACAAYSLSRTSWRERLRSVRSDVNSSLSALVFIAIQSAATRLGVPFVVPLARGQAVGRARRAAQVCFI